MDIPNTGKKEVRPIHRGEMLREEFLPDYGLTVSALAAVWQFSRVLAQCAACRGSMGRGRGDRVRG
jgi:hypothetical protein